MNSCILDIVMSTAAQTCFHSHMLEYTEASVDTKDVYIYIYIHIYTYMDMYIYVHMHREISSSTHTL